MKSQRFRSLWERKFFLFACASVAAFLFSATTFADQLDDLKKYNEECGKENDDAVAIYTSNSHDELKPEYNPETQCKENMGNEAVPLSHNARQISREAWSKRPHFIDFLKNEKESQALGACKMVYETIKNIYRHSNDLSEKYCRKAKIAIDKVLECEHIDAKCEKPLKEVRFIFSRYSVVKGEVIKAEAYLNISVKSSEQARKLYEKDLETLEIELRKRDTQGVAAMERADAIPERGELKASNGNANTQNLAQYHKLLAADFVSRNLSARGQSRQFGGPLITEHREAKKQAAQFISKLGKQTADKAVFANEMVQRLDTLLAGIEKAGPPKKTGLDKINSGIPVATGALGLGQKVLGNDTNTKAPPPTLSGGSSTPSLATLAAVGAAGAAFQNKFGDSAPSSGANAAVSPTTFQEPAKPLAPPETTKLGEVGVGQKNNSSADKNELPGSTNKTDSNKAADTAAGGNYPAFGASDGASRALAGAKKTRRAGAAAEGKPGGGSEDSFNAFGGPSLAPKPAQKSPQQSAGAEVANLLGQMKNLFNFDEGAPAGGGSPHAGSETPLDPNLAGTTTESEGDDATSQTAEAESSQTDEIEGNNPELGKQENESKASLFGRSDTSLFSRVHTRHTKCMERGLVLYQLGERVE